MEKQEAKELIINYLDDTLSAEGKSRLVNWVKMCDANKAYFTEVKDTWEATLCNANMVAQSNLEWEKLIARIKNEHNKAVPEKQRFLYFWQSVAAVLVVLLAISGWYTYNNYKKYDLLVQKEVKTIVPVGEKGQVILPDGTKVWINSGSELTYSMEFGLDARNVHLKGEAFFEVMHNEAQPFIVATKDCKVKVLGTRFNVNSYAENLYTETALEEGSVELLSNSGAELLMKPGQVAVTMADGSIEIKTSDVENLICWKDNVLRFDNCTLAEVVEKMERWYGVSIHIHQFEKMKDRRFTFTIKTETLNEILEIFQLVNPISYNINGDEVNITFQ